MQYVAHTIAHTHLSGDGSEGGGEGEGGAEGESERKGEACCPLTYREAVASRTSETNSPGSSAER